VGAVKSQELGRHDHRRHALAGRVEVCVEGADLQAARIVGSRRPDPLGVCVAGAAARDERKRRRCEECRYAGFHIRVIAIACLGLARWG
jgi:hypothetical protein